MAEIIGLDIPNLYDLDESPSEQQRSIQTRSDRDAILEFHCIRSSAG